MEQTRLTRASSLNNLIKSDALKSTQGRMQRAKSMDDMRTVEALPVVTPSKQQIGTALGIKERDLSKGQALLNQDFSRWDLSATAAKTNTTYNGFAKTILVGLKSIWNFVVNGSQLVTDAKTNQELLKNPVLATEAISYLADLRAKGVTVDVSQYRDDKLKQAKGSNVNLATARGKEEGFILSAKAFEARLPESMRSKLSGTADIFAAKQTSIVQIEAAINAISALAPSFDTQRQMVAAVTHNIAMEAGIINADGEIIDQAKTSFLSDQMSSLWIQSAPVGKNATPYAVTKFTDEIATNFNANKPESFNAIYDDVRNHAQLFAEALLTEKPGEEEGAENYAATLKEAQASFETQIWDSLKANDTFTAKVKSTVGTITVDHTRFHNYALTTDAVAESVIGSFQEISESNRGNQSGEEFFNMQLEALGTRMPTEMFSILNGFTPEEVATGTQEMSLNRLHEIDPTLAREDVSMSSSDLLTALGIEKSAGGNVIKFQEVGGDIYTVLSESNITTDENGANITGIIRNKQFTNETLADTLTYAGWHYTQVQRLVANFNAETKMVAPYEENQAISRSALQATLNNDAIPADQAQVIAANFNPATQMVNISAVVKNAQGSAALLKNIVPSNFLLAEVVRKHTNNDTAQVNIFNVFTDPSLLKHSAVTTETLRAGSTKAEAKAALFSRWIGYSNGGIMGQYQNALDFMRVEEAPSTRALEHYDADGKQDEIDALSNHLAALTTLATQGTVSENLQAARDDQKNTLELELQDSYARSLGLFKTGNINTGALEKRFNLQVGDYYSMLSKSLGLLEAGTTGSATLTRELLTHLNEEGAEALANGAEVDANKVAAYLLITEGKISWDEYAKLYTGSKAVKAADKRIIELLKGITSDAHGIDTISMRLRGLEESVTLAQFTNQIDEFRTHLQDVAQPALTRYIADIKTPIFMIENDNFDGVIAAVNTLGIPVLAQVIAEAISPALEGVERAPLLKEIQDNLNNLAFTDQKDDAADCLKKIVKASKLPREPLVIDREELDAVLREGEDS